MKLLGGLTAGSLEEIVSSRQAAAVREVTRESAGSILLVDDDPRLLFSLMMLFRRADYCVAAAPNAKEALHCLQQSRFDLVILDLKLPDTHGLCILPQILERFPGLPVIILTGDDSVSTTLDSIRLGATGYLVKPVEPGLILDCAERVTSLG